MALYVHYLYLLGKAGQRQYPPKMTSHLRREIMKFEQYKSSSPSCGRMESPRQMDCRPSVPAQRKRWPA